MKLLVLFWLGYFFIHSALASLKVKAWFAKRYPTKMPLYRLTFNALSAILLLPIVWQMFNYPGTVWWVWQGWADWLRNGLALVALYCFVLSLRHYDSQEFLGLRQLKSGVKEIEDQEAFRLSPFHRFVRHPWYFFSLVLIWTRDMNSAMLVSAVLLTLYFFIGSHLEEKKLIAYHGEVYKRYIERVPGLIPLPWKTLSNEEAAELITNARRDTAE